MFNFTRPLPKRQKNHHLRHLDARMMEKTVGSARVRTVLIAEIAACAFLFAACYNCRP
jgi:hypothetical protein